MYSRSPKGDEGTVEIQMAMYNSRGEKMWLFEESKKNKS